MSKLFKLLKIKVLHSTRFLQKNYENFGLGREFTIKSWNR
jgi:hypothetical protein